MIRNLTFIVFTLFGPMSCMGNPVSAAFSPGAYGDLTLAVNQSRSQISGIFASEGMLEDGQNTTWSCIFYFSGEVIADSRAAIVALSYDPSSGKFDSKHGEITSAPSSIGQPGVRIHFDDYPPGCARGEDFSKDSPRIGQDEGKPLMEIRIVIAKRSRFYLAPDAARVERSYVVRGDIVQVLGRNGVFVKASYENENGLIIGWLNEKDLQPLK